MCLRSTRLGGRRNGVLEGLHSRISLPPLNDDELKRLGKTIYPRIGHIVKAICKIFRYMSRIMIYLSIFFPGSWKVFSVAETLANLRHRSFQFLES